RARWHQVPAVLRTSTIWRFAPSPVTAWARWTAPGRVPHTGQVLAPAGLAAGAVLKVWGGAAGRPAGPPAPPARDARPAPAGGAGGAGLPCSGGPTCSAARGWPPRASWPGAAGRRGPPNGGPSGRPGVVTHDPPADRRRGRPPGGAPRPAGAPAQGTGRPV